MGEKRAGVGWQQAPESQAYGSKCGNLKVRYVKWNLEEASLTLNNLVNGCSQNIALSSIRPQRQTPSGTAVRRPKYDLLAASTNAQLTEKFEITLNTEIQYISTK